MTRKNLKFLQVGMVALSHFCITSFAQAATCERTLTADVVALDQAFFWNRLGAVQPQGMMYALMSDVVSVSGDALTPGNVQLRPDKRPRPLVLRMNVGDCLAINFTNLLATSPKDQQQPATRTASVHVMGLDLVGGIGSDGSNVGSNTSSLAAPGETKTYVYYASREGTNLLYSSAATTGGEGDGGSLSAGLFGAVNVEPRGAEWYRSQVTEEELRLATTGTTAGGQPLLNYNAVYPASHPKVGQPILKMLQGSEIVHTDINAIITGPSAGRFPAGTYPVNPVEPDREQPFREFTTIFHDETGAVQAFPAFEDPVLSHTLHSVRDSFAINYGSGGAGAEILANRLGVGPMHQCTECKYEEFFLTSWVVGDPAMVVDVPANATDATGKLITGPKATKALYPDDPSNVQHSYLNDHVKFRNLHAGPKEHHVFHLHAHQWLNTPDSDNSSYLDSQAIGPGTGMSYEIAHHGSGNRNKTVGDSIYHCHFYPHFAQGMWALWRTHDVFELGTKLDAEGRPAPGSRALPDGEIAAGTPIPAVVPLPTKAMAPLPAATVTIAKGQANIKGTGNPGYPFFVPGSAGHRPPHPPLDTVDDGGLPRHIITGGTAQSSETRLDFDKTLLAAKATQIPEVGTAVEKAAMAFHAKRNYASFTPAGQAASFTTNGLPAKPGAPFADPCVSDTGAATGTARTYKAAAFQLDLKLNKAGWHYPQSRILSLWEDVSPIKAGTKAPEPLFFRAKSGECITFYHTNLIPNVYEQDDFQVRTPTDLVGQHIHLVKFDVTSSDGSGNGWNYEDGTFSPGEVIERIHAINSLDGSWTPANRADTTKPAAKAHPYFGILGAQTTVQRWYADDVLNNLGQDRTLRTVFTHDHFGPSTHQQAGLYAGLVMEPKGSSWRDPETGTMYGSRGDGGPTSWRADILTANTADSYREFLFQLADYQLAYTKDNKVINPPAKAEVGLPYLLQPAPQCPGGVAPPCPEAVSAAEVGTFSVNYRNEPLALRVRDPATNTQAAGDAGDLSLAFSSNVTRADTALNTQPGFYPPLSKAVDAKDPFTPLARVYNNDKVQVRLLTGAHEEGHNNGINGIKWLFEPSDSNSGWRNNQMSGISEHFEFLSPIIAGKSSMGPTTDYLYSFGSSVDDLWNGNWGILRSYRTAQNTAGNNLLALPNNPSGGPAIANAGDFNGICPKTAPTRTVDITAVTAQKAVSGGAVVYNAKANLRDPTAILYVRTSDLDTTGKLLPGVPVEPLMLRANAGDCLNVTLRNRLDAPLLDLDGFNTLPMIVNNFNANQVHPSRQVALHPQLVSYDASRSDGLNVGLNPNQLATAPATGKETSQTYQWYAGDLKADASGKVTAVPVEFGATNLTSSDRIKHSNKGAIGALIIEPQGATWMEDSTSRASSTVTKADKTSFREFVLMFQDDVNLRYGTGTNGTAVPNTAQAEDPEDSGQKAFNYRTEPLWARMGFAPDAPLETTRSLDFTHALSNTLTGADPVTPVFTAKVGMPVRFRVLEPAGHGRNHVFQVHGHNWDQLPYTNGSTALGPRAVSERKGSQFGHGPGGHFDMLLSSAGGVFQAPGDYLFRDQSSFQFDGGLWGILRVQP
jgi:hypothetical protein